MLVVPVSKSRYRIGYEYIVEYEWDGKIYKVREVHLNEERLTLEQVLELGDKDE